MAYNQCDMQAQCDMAFNRMYKLYTFARSSTAFRTRIAFNLKAITPQYEYVALFKGQQKTSSYKAINPNMGVPSLILPDGTVLIQSMAIIQYLNQLYPQPNNLFPGTPLERAKVRGFCQVINSGIHPYQNLRLLEKIEKDLHADKKKWLDQWLVTGLNTIQNLFQKENQGKQFIFGEKVTCADVFFYPQVYSCKYRFKIDISPFKNVSRMLDNLQKIKEFQDAEPQKQKDFE